MYIFSKKKLDRGRRKIYFCGLKIFSYKKKNYVDPNLSLEKINEIQANFKLAEEKISQKIKNGEKINVTFLVCLAAMFPAKPLFERMLNDKSFNPNIVIIPDYRFGKIRAQQMQNDCEKELLQYYDRKIIYKAPINEEDDKINLNDISDIIFCSLPYDISHSKYSLLNLCKLNLLPAIVNYGFFRSYYDRNLIQKDTYGMFWKVFAETTYNLDEYKNYSMLKGKNVVLTGYCKMDNYKKYENKKNSQRKTVMIAPHHSIQGGFNNFMELSNFKKYSNFFLELPIKYPNIDFIFRPHPALFELLRKPEFWGEKKTEEYIQRMKSYKNVTYSDSGNYLKDFAESDGIIQDCGSYLVEYFYTQKPQCYMLKNKKEIEEVFTELGQKCLDNSYLAYRKKDILNFIDNVIIKGEDYKKSQRDNFAKETVMLNYPNVSDKIIEHIKSVFKGK